MPFPLCLRSPRREAPRTLRERLECSEGGNTGRRTRWSYPSIPLTGAAVRSAPGRGRAEGGLIRGRAKKARRISQSGCTAVIAAFWINSASRTASSTPSRICLASAPSAADARSFFMLPSRTSRLCSRSLWRNAGSYRARARSASVTGEKGLIARRSRLRSAAISPGFAQFIELRLSLSLPHPHLDMSGVAVSFAPSVQSSRRALA